MIHHYEDHNKHHKHVHFLHVLTQQCAVFVSVGNEMQPIYFFLSSIFVSLPLQVSSKGKTMSLHIFPVDQLSFLVGGGSWGLKYTLGKEPKRACLKQPHLRSRQLARSPLFKYRGNSGHSYKYY